MASNNYVSHKVFQLNDGLYELLMNSGTDNFDKFWGVGKRYKHDDEEVQWQYNT